MDTQKPFAEVIESSLSVWKAQTWQWDTFPTFGSLHTITTMQGTMYGVISNIFSGSTDPTRSPFTYQKTEDELKREQPQIFEFLKTHFSCIIVGYKHTQNIVYQIAPEPPKIHTFVKEASLEEYQEFFQKCLYLPIIFNSDRQGADLDELLLALLKNLKGKNINHENHISHFIDMFSLLTGNDYRRLKLFLSRLSQVL